MSLLPGCKIIGLSYSVVAKGKLKATSGNLMLHKLTESCSSNTCKMLKVSISPITTLQTIQPIHSQVKYTTGRHRGMDGIKYSSTMRVITWLKISSSPCSKEMELLLEDQCLLAMNFQQSLSSTQGLPPKPDRQICHLEIHCLNQNWWKLSIIWMIRKCTNSWSSTGHQTFLAPCSRICQTTRKCLLLHLH